MDEELTVEDHAYWWKETGQDELCQILFWRWDPIGVAGAFPSSRGEYDDYAGQVLGLLKAGSDADEIAAQLARIESETIGLAEGNDVAVAHRQEVATMIEHWYPLSKALWRQPSGR